MTANTNEKLHNKLIVKLDIEIIKKIFYNVVFYFLFTCIFELWRVWEASFIIIPFIAFNNSLEDILRAKNLLYKIKPGFKRELIYYILTLILSLLTVFPIMLLLIFFSIDRLYYYRLLVSLIVSFIPISIAYIGYKFGKI